MSDQSGLELPSVGECIARYFETRGWDDSKYAEVNKNAGLARQWVDRVVDGRDGRKPRRASLLKIAAAMDLTAAERRVLEAAAGLRKGSLRATRAEKVQEKEISMRRALLFLTAPTDPHRLPLQVKVDNVSTRSGVVFGRHDVVVRVYTPEDLSILEYADRLFASKKLRTLETIPIRDDLPIYVDRKFSKSELHAGDYYWAIIFIEALTTKKTPEPCDVFHEVALRPEFSGSIHLLTAGVVVGQFDTVVEVLAANLSHLQRYVRSAQETANDAGRNVHTVTYFSQRWFQTPESGGDF